MFKLLHFENYSFLVFCFTQSVLKNRFQFRWELKKIKNNIFQLTKVKTLLLFDSHNKKKQ